MLLCTSRGLLATHSLESGRASQPTHTLHSAPSGLGAFADCAFGPAGSALTVGLTPGLCVFDARAQSAKPTRTLPAADPAERFVSLACDDSAPHLVAAGSADTAAARVTRWDLRGGQVLDESVFDGCGPVWQLSFGGRGGGAPGLLCCTEGGALASLGLARRALCGEAVAVCALAVEPGGGGLAAATAGECLLYWDSAEAEEEDVVEDEMAG